MAEESVGPDFLKKYGLNEKESNTIFNHPPLQPSIFDKYKILSKADQKFYLKRFKTIGYQIDGGTIDQRRDIIREIIQENEKLIQDQAVGSDSEDSESDSGEMFLRKSKTIDDKENKTNNEKEIELLKDKTLHPEKYKNLKEDKAPQDKKPEPGQRHKKGSNQLVTRTSTTPSSTEHQRKYTPKDQSLTRTSTAPSSTERQRRYPPKDNNNRPKDQFAPYVPSEPAPSQPIPEDSKQKETQPQKTKFHKQAAFSSANDTPNTNFNNSYKNQRRGFRNNYNQNPRNNYNQNSRNNYNQNSRNNYYQNSRNNYRQNDNNQNYRNNNSQALSQQPRPTLTDDQRRILFCLSGKIQDDDFFFNDPNYSLQKVLTSEPVDVNGERLPMNVPYDLGILFIQIFSKDITPEQRLNYQLTKTELITVQLPGDVIIQFEPIQPDGDQPAKIQFTFFSSPTLQMTDVKNIVENGLNSIAFSEWHEFKVTNVDYLTDFNDKELVDLAAQYHTVIRIIDNKVDNELESRSITFRVLKLCLNENELKDLVSKVMEWFDNARLCKCKNCYCIYPHIDTKGECRFRGHVGTQIPFDDSGNMEEIEFDDEGEEFIMVNYT